MTGGLDGGQATTKGGNIILRGLNVPDSVRPGESFDVSAEVSNGAVFIVTGDPDRCDKKGPSGYRTTVEFSAPMGERTAGPRCHVGTEIGTKDERYGATFTAPDSPGTVPVSAKVVMPGSGKTTDSITKQVTVTESEPEPARESDSDANGSGNYGNLFGGGGGGGGSPTPSPFAALTGGGTEQIAAVVVLALLAWLAASASDTVEAVA